MEEWSQDILTALQNTEIKSGLYDQAFYRDHLKYRPVYNTIGDIIMAHLNPKSVVDWGCGCGFLLERLHGYGVADILGLEGSAEVQPVWVAEIPVQVRDNFVLRDISTDLDFRIGTYELAVCMEVAEHIDADKAEGLIKRIAASSSKYLYWTAAQPGQGGTGHINCRSLCYWVEQFAKHTEFTPDWELTYKIKLAMLQNHAIALAYPWYRDNLLVLSRG